MPTPPRPRKPAPLRRKRLWMSLGALGGTAGLYCLIYLAIQDGSAPQKEPPPPDNSVSANLDRLINRQVAEMETIKLAWNDPRRQALEMSLMARNLPKIFEERLAAMFAKLGLPADEKQALLDLLVEREVLKEQEFYAERGNEVVVRVPPVFPIKIPGDAITTHKAPPPEDYLRRKISATRAVEGKIVALLGDEKYAVCMRSVDTALLRAGVVDQMQKALVAGKKTILKEAQIERLLDDLMAANPPARLYRLDKITPSVVEQAPEYLDANQTALLDQIQKANEKIEGFVDKAIEAGNYTAAR
jgi:hypothetical protein